MGCLIGNAGDSVLTMARSSKAAVENNALGFNQSCRY
ncbi:hypothetical protein DBV23_12180 [Edwardsiella ictaluri]|nr:hypothetical protein DBV23_12180 [Edwardsiella ictaluri]EKS7764797.1 VENN motif pre-toxin domain-containing protein [Edwardsiella ictaluri]EKS7771698.1 VENN motif pre-toxin domain-containing protein [Edwardsiella ictaluri]EKS7774878.1 VENN motif pre-toxin domain-containing protein [Edwardsiella ictaluri]EKS7778173.1 VENN motif pre-toxin domain-containing protein [Edwardsiella ictaluri]